jgi:hypothetical protein
MKKNCKYKQGTKSIKNKTLLQPKDEVEFQKWRSNLPSNLRTDDSSYDLRGAYKGGLTPEVYEDGSYHLGTRVPSSGQILKAPNHPTYKMGLEEDMKLGYVPQAGKDGRIYTKNIMKEPQFRKGTKKVKIKKAEFGLQKIDPGVLGMAGTLGATGIEAMTATKYQSKYTDQLKDQDQMFGKSIGQGAGMALNFVAPGLGTVAAPILGAVGGAVQRGFQENKLKEFKRKDEYNQRVQTANENITADPTTNQRMQYASGGTVKPYKAKNAKDYKYRKQMYDDSLALHNQSQKQRWIYPETPKITKEKFKELSAKEDTYPLYSFADKKYKTDLKNKKFSGNFDDYVYNAADDKNQALSESETSDIKFTNIVDKDGVTKMYGSYKGKRDKYPSTEYNPRTGTLRHLDDSNGSLLSVRNDRMKPIKTEYKGSEKKILEDRLSVKSTTTGWYDASTPAPKFKNTGTKNYDSYSHRTEHKDYFAKPKQPIEPFKDPVAASKKSYNDKYPPVYVNDSKDPRIGQYTEEGNQWLYKDSAKKTKPYRAKNAKDYKFRKEAYADSLDMYNHFGKVATVPLSEEEKSFYAKQDNQPIGRTGTHHNDSLVYAKPKQEVLPPAKQFTPNKTIPKLATKNSTLESNPGELNIPEKIDQPKPKGYKRVFKPSNQPGYKQLREYGKYEMEPQYSKGTKVIEIEGKKSPEIHTDENFNIKNLGTTPHSKGGDKVLAEGGDVVFPTQNDPNKFNEIMGAIKRGDKSKLKKEQSKLPTDKAPSKYPDGVGKLKPVLNIDGKPLYYDEYNHKGTYEPGGYEQTVANGTRYGAGQQGNKYPYPTIYNEQSKRWYSHQDEIAPLAMRNTLGGEVSGKNIPTTLPEYKSPATTSLADNSVPDNLVPDKVGNNLGNIGKYAGIINNFAQSFKPSEKVDRSYVNPELIKYQDRSDPLRRQSNAKQSVDMANSRNLSAGNVANARANQQMASIGNYSRQESINNNEMQRSDAIDVQNVGIKNQFKQLNNQLKIGFDDMDAKNRAARGAYRDTAINDVVKVSQLNEQMSNQKQYSKDYLNVLNNMYNYGFDPDNIGNPHFTGDKTMVAPPTLPKVETSVKEKKGNTTTTRRVSTGIRNMFRRK